MFRKWIGRMRAAPAAPVDPARRAVLGTGAAALAMPSLAEAGGAGFDRLAAVRNVRALAYVDAAVFEREIEAALDVIATRLPEARTLFELHRIAATRSRRGWVTVERDLDPTPLHRACVGARAVRFAYMDRLGQSSRREVWPLEIIAAPSGAQLLAFCTLRGAQRKFFLREMRDVRVTNRRFTDRRPGLLRAALDDLRRSYEPRVDD